jgi:hypothetical protein
MKIVLAEGLVTTEGAARRRLRRMSQPAFHHERIAALAVGMTAAIAASPVVLIAQIDSQRALKKSPQGGPAGPPGALSGITGDRGIADEPERKPEPCQRQG